MIAPRDDRRLAYEDRYRCPACDWNGAVPGGWRRHGTTGCFVRVGILVALVVGPAIGRAGLPGWALAALYAIAAIVLIDAVRVFLARRREVERARAAGGTEVCPACGEKGLEHERAVVPE